MALGATYVVPALNGAQPWAAGEDYIPFWNVIGREVMGQEPNPSEVNVALVGTPSPEDPAGPVASGERLAFDDPKAAERDREQRQANSIPTPTSIRPTRRNRQAAKTPR